MKPAVEIYDTGEFTASGSRRVKRSWKGVNGDSIEWQDAIKWRMTPYDGVSVGDANDVIFTGRTL